jgi:8-oxo-dGTP diphosphatase
MLLSFLFDLYTTTTARDISGDKIKGVNIVDNVYKVRLGVHLVLIESGKILLMRRCNTGWNDGIYNLIAGHVEEGEGPKDAMAREALEEAGVMLDLNKLEIAHMMFMRSDFDSVNLFIRAEVYDGQIRNIEPEKCDDMRWFDLNNLPENISKYAKFALEQIKDGRPYSEFNS